MSLWDNTDTIELLVRAGADANARFADNITPHMLAYEDAWNIRPLLDDGARMDARNKWGQTALDLTPPQSSFSNNLLPTAKTSRPQDFWDGGRRSIIAIKTCERDNFRVRDHPPRNNQSSLS